MQDNIRLGSHSPPSSQSYEECFWFRSLHPPGAYQALRGLITTPNKQDPSLAASLLHKYQLSYPSPWAITVPCSILFEGFWCFFQQYKTILSFRIIRDIVLVYFLEPLCLKIHQKKLYISTFFFLFLSAVRALILKLERKQPCNISAPICWVC